MNEAKKSPRSLEGRLLREPRGCGGLSTPLAWHPLVCLVPMMVERWRLSELHPSRPRGQLQVGMEQINPPRNLRGRGGCHPGIKRRDQVTSSADKGIQNNSSQRDPVQDGNPSSLRFPVSSAQVNQLQDGDAAVIRTRHRQGGPSKDPRSNAQLDPVHAREFKQCTSK
ncbi:hypothetical protein NDU88_001405 [Pleurodeles waltl]|uniref:Uncharacterized protein n=1 Tax=Pleurodeles waltl TaxID=8319 RepID=A0AAV7U8B3_PLEWA|nr:hypothetical protein NDU88_001405 [Pleurodeles waltl]